MIEKEEIFEYPKWQDCQWRREPCNQTDCPLCFRLMKLEQKHRIRGEDPNDMEVVLNDVAESFEETRMMIEENAEELGIDLDNIPVDLQLEERDQMDHPLQKVVHAWVLRFYGFISEVSDEEASWLGTDYWKDLTWYHSILSAKVYRQLSNIWDMEHVDRDRSDYVYTKGVIEEVVSILNNAFQKLLLADLSYCDKTGLQNLYNEFQNFGRLAS